ncbi:uncharacterized protein LOC132734585 [Ruditapes philippinarum]|uniref:uncharacterized protein LOC132734585 n=1 Tax=Ruditapes philippinarum TaxID=129788 RepID=UPI00295C3265|nr:uncharacterized protein LOC132734585 [Ruditapes philippinarum]
MGLRCVVWCQVSFGIIIPWLLHTFAVFSPFWLIEDGVMKGLFYQRLANGSPYLEVLDQATLGLQTTSFILLLFCLISCCITASVYGPDEDGDIENEFRSCFGCNCLWFYCNIGVYVITSILMMSGCWRLGSLFPMEHIGPSFYLCLSSFLLIWLSVFIFICDHVCKRRHADSVYHTLIEKIYDGALD